jgi:uncharacterized protein YdeI (YjbR/CyaY-like superfamily)
VLIQPRTRGEWREWLAKNHAVSKGIWVVLIKKGSGLKGITYEAAVEEALCYGWIDTRPNTIDEGRYKLHLTPRRAGSVWSKSNKARIRRLMKLDLMASPGLAKMQAAKKDGSWAQLDAIDRLEMPADLLVALSGDERAREHFAAFGASAKKVILFWIATAKRPETQQNRIEETVRLAAANIKAAH